MSRFTVNANKAYVLDQYRSKVDAHTTGVKTARQEPSLPFLNELRSLLDPARFLMSRRRLA